MKFTIGDVILVITTVLVGFLSLGAFDLYGLSLAASSRDYNPIAHFSLLLVPLPFLLTVISRSRDPNSPLVKPLIRRSAVVFLAIVLWNLISPYLLEFL